jgi:hypothetical protein
MSKFSWQTKKNHVRYSVLWQRFEPDHSGIQVRCFIAGVVLVQCYSSSFTTWEHEVAQLVESRRSWSRDTIRSLNFFSPIYLTLPAALGRGFYKSFKKNWYLKQKQILGSRASSLSELFGKCGILDISQSYGPPRPVTGTALLYGDEV